MTGVAAARGIPRESVESTGVSYAQFEQLREARSVIQHEADVLAELAKRLDTEFCQAVELLHSVRGRVVVCGLGKAGLIGQKLAATLASTGTPSQFLHPTEALHGDLGCLSGQDLLLALSNSGETQEVCDVVTAVKSLNVPCVAITASDQSSLGGRADVVIRLGKIREAGPFGLAPTASTTAMLAIGDALALVVSRLRGFTAQHFARVHPGGSLGRRLRSVSELMRRGDQLRIASHAATIRQVFTSSVSTGRRTGAVMLTDDDGRLSGIFTDSDLARLLERHRDGQWDRPIAEVMTTSPMTIRGDALLTEAVEMLSAKKISELPVIDADGRPIGLLDITDVIGVLPGDHDSC